jgi:HTH-type transcriptional regulator / antitoxin HigA
MRRALTKVRYLAALKEIEGLMDAAAGTRRGKRLDTLARLVEAYEKRRFPLSASKG